MAKLMQTPETFLVTYLINLKNTVNSQTSKTIWQRFSLTPSSVLSLHCIYETHLLLATRDQHNVMTYTEVSQINL